MLLPRLFIAASIILVSFLAYGSQILFYYIEPGPLKGGEIWTFNLLVGITWVCYARACLVDPGRIRSSPAVDTVEERSQGTQGGGVQTGRANAKDPVPDGTNTGLDSRFWCTKCDAKKPPRAHHCKVCKRCIPKMDHHCPWTANCVSHTTFPHFLRFLFYGVAAACQLTSLLFTRVKFVWYARDLPSYLGPSAWQLGLLFALFLVNSLNLFAVGIILIRTIYSVAANVTAIESWEIERHETLARRARKHGGYLDGPDGIRIRLSKQEFPYDIGILKNICQGMGGNPLVWFWPFARTPSVSSGLSFEVNGFDENGLPWPPPDPDRMPRANRAIDVSSVHLELEDGPTDSERLAAFKQRQEADFRERKSRGRAWKNSEGEQLGDYGVDEEVLTNDDSEEDIGEDEDDDDDDDDDDDVPLGNLIRKRNQKRRSRSSSIAD